MLPLVLEDPEEEDLVLLEELPLLVLLLVVDLVGVLIRLLEGLLPVLMRLLEEDGVILLVRLLPLSIVLVRVLEEGVILLVRERSVFELILASLVPEYGCAVADRARSLELIVLSSGVRLVGFIELTPAGV